MTHRILMYHGIVTENPVGQVSADQFERQIKWLKRFSNFLTAEEFFQNRGRAFRKPGVLLTFDDGYKNNLHVVAPILKRLKVPAIFFVSLRHCDPHKYLWFSHMRALQQAFRGNEITLRGQRLDLSESERANSFEKLKSILFNEAGDPEKLAALLEELPKPEDVLSEKDLNGRWRGMTEAEIRELASEPLFEIGSHTFEHPALSRCSDEVVQREVGESRLKLEAILGKPVRYFAYPSGDYDARAVKMAKQHYKAAFAVRDSMGVDPDYEITRLGVYNPSIRSLFVKFLFGNFLRKLKIPVS